MQNIYFFNIFWKKSLMLTKAVYLIAKQQQKTDVVKYYYNLKQLYSILIYFSCN